MTRYPAVGGTLAAILAALTLVAGSDTATADEVQWKCCAGSCSPKIHEIQVTLTADRTKRTGTFTFDGRTQKTDYGTNGFNRIWAWKEGRTSRLVLDVHGTAEYYNLAGAQNPDQVRPSEFFTCERLGR